MKVGVVVFPGSNCDRDMYHVLSDVFNLNPKYFWHEKNLPNNIDAVILYSKKQGVIPHPITKVINPAIVFRHKIWKRAGL